MCLRVLFLREQVRDLRVQAFLRELVVGIAAPSDLARSILVETLHSVKGGDVSKGARTSKQFSRVCDCSSLTHLCLYLACLYCSYLYMFDILVLNRYNCLDCLISCILIFLAYFLHLDIVFVLTQVLKKER